MSASELHASVEGGSLRDVVRSITVPRQLFEDLLEDAMELRGERGWWKDEPRCNYQRDYEQLCARIDEGVRLRDASNKHI